MNLNRVARKVLKARAKQKKAQERKAAADALCVQAFEAAGVNFHERKGTRVQVEEHSTRRVSLDVLSEHLEPEVVGTVVKVGVDVKKLDAAVKVGTIPEEVADKATQKSSNTQVRVYGEGEVREERG